MIAEEIVQYNILKYICSQIKNYIFKKVCYLHVFKNSNSDHDFYHYLVGLIEGDGSIIVPLKSNNIKYPAITIVFHIKDYPLA
jgi:hypothetical protein